MHVTGEVEGLEEGTMWVGLAVATGPKPSRRQPLVLSLCPPHPPGGRPPSPTISHPALPVTETLVPREATQ